MQYASVRLLADFAVFRVRAKIDSKKEFGAGIVMIESGEWMRMDTMTVGNMIINSLGASLLSSDRESWSRCLGAIPRDRYVSVHYKPSFIEYQKEYFSSVYEDYVDCSMILERGGIPIGIWPVCTYKKDGKIIIGSNGGELIEPLFSYLPKAEAQRDVIQRILDALLSVMNDPTIPMIGVLSTSVAVLDEGTSQWQKKWMEAGAKCTGVKWWVYTDLNLSIDEIQHRIRRTNRYSVDKAKSEYDIKIFDSYDDIDKTFEEFHDLHYRVSGRETRSQATWDLQRESIKANSDENGWDFVVSLRDRVTKELTGMALFVATPQTSYYAVGAYDRSRFAKPIGHAAQAVAIEYMKSKGVRWYEIGERSYPRDAGGNEKLINIGKYKEGFATHTFPKITLQIAMET